MTVANWVSCLIEDSLDIKLFNELLKVNHVLEINYLWSYMLCLWIFSNFNNWALFWIFLNLCFWNTWLFGSFVFLNFDRWIYRGSRNRRLRMFSISRSYLTSSPGHWMKIVNYEFKTIFVRCVFDVDFVNMKMIDLLVFLWLWWADDKYQSNKYILF
jgi:hypothetical protein